MVIGYARVSTEQQNTATQLPTCARLGVRRSIRRQRAGEAMDRPELESAWRDSKRETRWLCGGWTGSAGLSMTSFESSTN